MTSTNRDLTTEAIFESLQRYTEIEDIIWAYTYLGNEEWDGLRVDQLQDSTFKQEKHPSSNLLT